jgi:hypothetical protein
LLRATDSFLIKIELSRGLGLGSYTDSSYTSAKETFICQSALAGVPIEEVDKEGGQGKREREISVSSPTCPCAASASGANADGTVPGSAPAAQTKARKHAATASETAAAWAAAAGVARPTQWSRKTNTVE